jgi:hypothetical protein
MKFIFKILFFYVMKKVKPYNDHSIKVILLDVSVLVADVYFPLNFCKMN